MSNPLAHDLVLMMLDLIESEDLTDLSGGVVVTAENLGLIDQSSTYGPVEYAVDPTEVSTLGVICDDPNCRSAVECRVIRGRTHCFYFCDCS